jgi:hypothetical protein
MRIHTGQKWPEAVVMDTNLPAIVSPMIAASLEKAPRDAFAMAQPDKVVTRVVLAARVAPATIAPKRIAARHRRSYRAASGGADHETRGFGNVWFGGW